MARYKAGESGNLRGRPKGIKDKRVRHRELLEPHAEKLVAKAVELAIEGDTTALRLCLERIAPPIRAKDEPVDIGNLKGSLSEQGQAIVAAMGRGRITPSEAATMLSAITSQSRIVEGDELAARVEALEQSMERRR